MESNNLAAILALIVTALKSAEALDNAGQGARGEALRQDAVNALEAVSGEV